MFLFIKIIFLFAVGACFGSFANVLVDRGQKGQKITGFSKCDFCHRPLKWYDNIPILSFFLLGGKCRRCRKKLSPQYPLMEAIAGFLFLLIGWQSGFLDPSTMLGMTNNVMIGSPIESGMTNSIFGMTENNVVPIEGGKSKILNQVQDDNLGIGMTDNNEWIPAFAGMTTTLIFLLFTAFLFWAIFLWDLKYMIIPDKLIIIGTLGALIYYLYLFLISGHSIFNVHSVFTSNLIGGLIVFLFFLAMFYFSQGRWIGGGDVKLGFWIGFLVGWEKVYLMLLLVYILGGLAAGILILRKKKTLKSQIPFGPFLLAGCFIVLLWGEKILEWYRNFLIF